MGNSVWKWRSVFREALSCFFSRHRYIEIETPILVCCPGMEEHLEYFETEWVNHDKQKSTYFLRSSPELHMKQALALDGLSKIYQFSKSFRNGGEFGPWHHPEFLLLEWYETEISYEAFRDQTVDLILYVQQFLFDNKIIKSKIYKNFIFLTVEEAFEKFAGIKLIDQDPELVKKARHAGNHSVQDGDDFSTAFFKIMLDQIEPRLAKLHAVMLYDYPPSQACLAKIKNHWACRFEVYLSGIEISNGFLELTDFLENKSRFQSTLIARKKAGKTIYHEDHAFYRSLQKGLPPCCGNALGFDRTLASLLGHKDLRQVVPFRSEWT